MKYKFHKIALAFSLFIICWGCRQKTEQTAEKKPVLGSIAPNGMVSTAPTQVGLEVLQKGGNAFDAAIAVQFALAVVYPRAGNIGGGGFLVYRKADGETGSLDFREKAPASASRDMYLDEAGEVIPNLSLKGHRAVGVPGTVDGMAKIHEKLGSLPWNELLKPAIRLARKGYQLLPQEADKLNQYLTDFQEQNRFEMPFWKESNWQTGDSIHQPELANTLTHIAEKGRAGFYEGVTARLLLEEMEAGNGIIYQTDLDAYQAVWRDPLKATYRNHTIISMPPPSSGGVALIQLLKGLEAYPPSELGHNSTTYIHLLTELMRRVYADRATHLGDMDFYDVPIDLLISKEYNEERNATISLAKKTDSQEVKAGDVQTIESFETTHFSIVDKGRNAVAITTTLNGNYGSKVMVKGGGFFLNNEMDDFSIKPGVPNQFGLVGGEANAIEPGKRMLSSMTPTLVEKNGELFLAVGTPGGSTIITSVFQTIVNVIDFEMTLQEAINSPKVHAQWLPDRIYFEKGKLDEKVLDSLKQLGHATHSTPILGKMNCIRVLSNGELEGGADYLRSEGIAEGY